MTEKHKKLTRKQKLNLWTLGLIVYNYLALGLYTYFEYLSKPVPIYLLVFIGNINALLVVLMYHTCKD